MGTVKDFIREHYRHFNAATVVDASDAYIELLEGGGKMFVTLAGAMSTAELGRSLAEMIRQGKVHAITCTGANLEEDVFNLVANSHYKRVPNYRGLSVKDEEELYEAGFNRVTDTCIPEEEAMRRIEKEMLALWRAHEDKGESLLPHQYFYELLLSGKISKSYDADPKNSWLLAAAERTCPSSFQGGRTPL